MTRITADKNDGKITIEQDGKVVTLTAEDSPYVYHFFKIVGYEPYKRLLLKKQGYRCADCGKSKKELELHHDPPLGSPGSRYIDRAGKTKNRMLCKGCHKLADSRLKNKRP